MSFPWLYFIGGSILIMSPLWLGYLWLVNRAIVTVPKDVGKISPRRWTKKEMLQTFERIQKKPVPIAPHLPPKLGRRYVVVGSSGLVGGYMVLHLLQRGQSPESIRMVDFVPPKRADMLSGQAAHVDYIQADITSEASIRAAFDKPWPPSVANLPLTVLHPAAVINFVDRARIFLHRVNNVNLTGTANVLSAAKRAGADVFLATASASIALQPVNFWIWPWQENPKNFFQIIDERDAYAPLREHYDYFGNYAVSKAHAEKLVLAANAENFRTGCIRPANGVYGTRHDHTIGTYLNRGNVPTWIPFICQNFVDAEHISLAHLKFEQALLTPGNKVGGKSFVITDPNAPVTFTDIYNLLELTSATGFSTTYIPPIFMLLVAYPVELYNLAKAFFPLLNRILPNLSPDINMLQPTLFSVSCCHVIANDSAAQKSIQEGGIGYRGVRTSLEGMCMVVKSWNDDHRNAYSANGVVGLKDDLKNIGAVPAATGGGRR